MSARRLRVVFVCHSAARNGATVLLVDLLRWMAHHLDWELRVVVQGSGPLLDELRAVAPTRVWRDPSDMLDVLRLSRQGRTRWLIEHLYRAAFLPVQRCDVVYANTIAAAPLAKHLSARADAMLLHVHELAYAMRLAVPEAGLGDALQRPDRMIAASEAVKRVLCDGFSVGSGKVDVIHSFTPLSAPPAPVRRAVRDRVRTDLGMPPDAFVVGACGSHGWRKGTDLFVQIARGIGGSRARRDIRFLWVGGRPGSREWLEFEHDVAAAGLKGCCSLVPVTSEVSDYYCAMDAFAMTSREEPLGLVVLEAAEHELPTVCFADAGGAEEFVRDDAGICVPYLDLAAFEHALLRLHDDPGLRQRCAASGRERVNSSFRVEAQAPRVVRSIEACLNSHRGAPAPTAGLESPQTPKSALP
jgi:glycosyltransferase involved in cell wall biosynthesis